MPSAPMTGPATCASWRTCCSGWPCLPRAARSGRSFWPRTCTCSTRPPDGRRRVAKSRWVQNEEQRIREALESCGGNVAKARALLDIPHATMYRKMKRYGIDRREYEPGDR